jgi:hypothetical protein
MSNLSKLSIQISSDEAHMTISIPHLVKVKLSEWAEFLLERQLTNTNMNLFGDSLVVRIDIQHHILKSQHAAWIQW